MLLRIAPTERKMTTIVTPPSPQADLDLPVWGAEPIGQIIGRDERQTFHLLENALIDATKVGRQWVSTPRRLLKSIGALAESAT
jgi:hypothetical protein